MVDSYVGRTAPSGLVEKFGPAPWVSLPPLAAADATA